MAFGYIPATYKDEVEGMLRLLLKKPVYSGFEINQ